MKFRLLPSAFVRSSPHARTPAAQPLTSFIVTGAQGAGPLAIDAGSLGLIGEPEDMAEIRDVVLTHAHIDHVATLPMWIEALLSQNRAPVRVHASRATVEHLRTHLFNGVIFPDFERLTETDGRPLMEFSGILEDEPFTLAGFSLTAFRTNHPIETHGYVVDDGEDAILFAADSGPCDTIWQVAKAAPRLRAVVIEASFPDFMGEIAMASGHLTPALLASECAHVPDGVRVFVTHMKPAYREGIARAISNAAGPRIEILDPGVEIDLAS